MCEIVLKNWYTPGFTLYAKRYHAHCLICQLQTLGKTVQTTMLAHPRQGHFEALQIDFTLLFSCSQTSLKLKKRKKGLILARN